MSMESNGERHKSSSSSSSTNTTASSSEPFDTHQCLSTYECDFRYFDLSALPLIGILARREKTMVLRVRREGCESVVKLHQGKVLPASPGSQSIPISNGTKTPRSSSNSSTTSTLGPNSNLAKIEGKSATLPSSWKLLQRLDPFSNEVALLVELQRSVPALVRIHGWGEAQTYKGIVLEALKGQPLSSQLNKPTFYFPAPLQLLYRLMWAIQITRAIADIHGSGIFHGDICANNFAFRSNPSHTDFGQLAVFDLDKASRMSYHSPNYLRARKTFYDHYKEFAETRASQYLPTDSSRTYCDLFTYIQQHAEGQLPSKTQPDLTNALNNRRVAHPSGCCGVLCEHKAGGPPSVQSTSSSRYTELPLPAGPPCGKEHTTSQATQTCCQELLSKSAMGSANCHDGGLNGLSSTSHTSCSPQTYGKFLRSPNVQLPLSFQSTTSSPPTSSPSSWCSTTTGSMDSPLVSAKVICMCPSCECKEGRAEIVNVSFLLAECFSMFVYPATELKQCKGCWKRLPLSDQRLNEWADLVSAYIDGLILHTSRYEECVAISDVIGIRAKIPDTATASTTTHTANSTHTTSTTHSQSINTLIRQRHHWAVLRHELIARLYSIVHRALSEDIMSRPTALELHESLLRVVEPFYRFMRKICPNTPDCGEFTRKLSSSRDPDARKRQIKSWLDPAKCKTPSSSVDAL